MLPALEQVSLRIGYHGDLPGLKVNQLGDTGKPKVILKIAS